MNLRLYKPEDLEEIVRLFSDTVLTVNRKDYSSLQVETWAGRGEALLLRNDFFETLYTIVAVEQGVLAGYGNIDPTGYLDHLFVHKDFQKRGIASAICQELERHAVENGRSLITVHASITAKPFFEKRGYRAVREQEVYIKTVPFLNYVMEKEI